MLPHNLSQKPSKRYHYFRRAEHGLCESNMCRFKTPTWPQKCAQFSCDSAPIQPDVHTTIPNIAIEPLRLSNIQIPALAWQPWPLTKAQGQRFTPKLRDGLSPCGFTVWCSLVNNRRGTEHNVLRSLPHRISGFSLRDSSFCRCLRRIAVTLKHEQEELEKKCLETLALRVWTLLKRCTFKYQRNTSVPMGPSSNIMSCLQYEIPDTEFVSGREWASKHCVYSPLW